MIKTHDLNFSGWLWQGAALARRCLLEALLLENHSHATSVCQGMVNVLLATVKLFLIYILVVCILHVLNNS